MIWLREHLEPMPRVDAVIFDVDGVLIDDAVSFYEAVKATVAYVLSTWHHLPAACSAITDADIMAFKAAGGFNDDWDLAYAVSGLLLSGAAHTAQDLARIAGESAGRGKLWVQEAYFPHLGLDYGRVRRIGVEHYWGADRLRQYLGLHAEFYAGPGFVWLERSLVPTDYFERLRAAGVRRFGIITGRDAVELRSALETLGLSDTAFDFVLDSSMLRKPDPRALSHAIEALAPAAALYLGDTGDDLRLVLNYRAQPHSAIPCLAAMIPKAGHGTLFQAAGADLTLDAADELPSALQLLDALRRQPAS